MRTKILLLVLTILTSTSFAQIGIGTQSPTEQFHTTLGVRFEGITQMDSLSRILTQDQTGKLFWRNASSLDNNFWSLRGNSNTSPATNFIGTIDSKDLVFKTFNTTRATILSNGYFGIGLTAPQSKLEVYTTTPDNHIRVTGVSPSILMFNGVANPTQIARIGFVTTTNNFVQGSISGDLVLQTLGNNNNLILGTGGVGTGNGIERARINPSGYLGIGTQNPTEQLHTTAGVKFEGITQRDSLSRIVALDQNGKLYWRNVFSLDSNSWGLKGNAIASLPGSFIGTTDNSDLVFKTFNTTKATLLANGYFGIGLTAPQSKLEVYTTTPDNHIRVTGVAPSIVMFNGLANPTQVGRLGFVTNTNNFVQGSVPGDVVLQTVGNSNNLILGTGNSGGNGIERARINPNGYLGIATNNPTSTLHVKGTVKFENLPSGLGDVLVIDASGNIYRNSALGRPASNINIDEVIEKNNKIQTLETEINRLRLLVDGLIRKSVVKQ